MTSVLGVLVDGHSHTLCACSSDLSAAGVTIPGGQKPVALKTFDLTTGSPKGSVALPGDRTLCNAIAIDSRLPRVAQELFYMPTIFDEIGGQLPLSGNSGE